MRKTPAFCGFLIVDNAGIPASYVVDAGGPNDKAPWHPIVRSLALYNEHRFFAPNVLDRTSLGTRNRDLVKRLMDR
ncbi:MAG: hypothetical protein U0Z70_19690 [Thermomicrobiales bacterium]